MTPGQFQRCLKGYNKRLQADMKMQDSLNFILGQYITIGFNNPKKYPKKPRLSEPERKRYLTNEELMKEAKAMTIRMGGTVN